MYISKYLVLKYGSSNGWGKTFVLSTREITELDYRKKIPAGGRALQEKKAEQTQSQKESTTARDPGMHIMKPLSRMPVLKSPSTIDPASNSLRRATADRSTSSNFKAASISANSMNHSMGGSN